ncbi:uncharacterized protein KGF55_002334 [Candida pseudojiufengensis]|uniref:uncharacterized protein n=1 Tax=Candida pseudojiufengensis TaxID=497109 RepID=UPI0022251E74|nr:uncharacterized protein KGF55_002334 [Candida pseudojiufengensis]KAI5963454.1 hypothetical protein KGF55_002334 [Candida pseudojiufengensis]
MSKFTSQVLHVTTKHSQNETLNSFQNINYKRNKIPDKEIVNFLFEKLLSIRIFSKEAVNSLRRESLERKWELLLRENETNSSFDLSVTPHQLIKERQFDLEEFNSKNELAIKDNSPEWYISQIMANNLKLMHFKTLEKKLDNKSQLNDSDFNWVDSFLFHQGDSALSAFLLKIAKRSVKSNEELDIEYLIIKCLKHILHFEREESLQSGMANSKKTIINALSRSLRSPRIATRVLVTELFINLIYYSKGDEEIINSISNETGKFKSWFDVVKSSLSNNWLLENVDSYLANYFTITLMMVNSILQSAGSLRKRCLLRQDYKKAGIADILEKANYFKNIRIRNEIDKYTSSQLADNEFSREKVGKSLPRLPVKSSNEDCLVSSSREIVHGTKLDIDIETIFKEFFSQGQKSNDIKKTFEIFEIILTKLLSNDNVSNVSIQRLIDGLASEVTTRKAIEECGKLQKEIKFLKESNELLKQNYSIEDTEEKQKIIDLQNEQIVSQKKQIGLLQRQIKQFEEDKGRSARQRIITHSFDDLADTRKNSPKKSTIYSNNVPANCVYADLNDTSSSSFHRGPPTPPALLSKFDILSDSEIKLPTRKPNLARLLGLEPSNDIGTIKSSSPLNVPTPPPVPGFLDSKETSASSSTHSSPPPNVAISTEPPEVASAPPLPDFLKKATSSAPNPPSLPTFLQPAINPSNLSPNFSTNSKTDNPAAVTSSSTSPLAPPAPPLAPPLPPPIASPLAPAPPLAPPIAPSLAKVFSHSSKKKSQAVATKSDNNSSISAEDKDAGITLSSSRPKVKLKQFHWNKINDIERTFWKDMELTSLSDKLAEQGVFDDIEKVFVATTPNTKKTIEKKENEPTNKISFLPRDLAQQFGINLYAFAGLSEEKLVMKILRCHSDVLENISVIEFFNNDALFEISDSLSKNLLPYSSDPRTKRLPTKDPNNLDRPDRIFLELCFNLRHYWRARSKALLFAQTYQKDYHDLSMRLDLLDMGIECLNRSENFRKVLSVIKLIGNFMNGASKQASGFTLDTLQRLKFMKDESNSMSFLHYIEKIIRQSFPEYSSFVDELNELYEIQNITTEQLELDCQEMIKNLNIINNALENGKLSRKNDLHPSDRIITILNNSMKDADEKIQSLQTHMKDTMSKHKSIMTFFGESINDGNSSRDTFFSKIMIFVTEYKKAHVENIQKEEEQKVYEMRKKKIEDVLAKNLQDGSKYVDSVEDASAAIDRLLEKLRTAGHKKDRKTKKNKSDYLDSKSSDSDAPGTADLEYESVNNLKRRLTNRKKNNDKEITKVDHINTVSRAQVMLQQLRNGQAEDQTDKKSDSQSSVQAESIVDENEDKENFKQEILKKV